MKKIAIVMTMMFVFTAFASTALASNGGEYIINKTQEDGQKRIESKQDTTKNKKEETPCVDPKTETKQNSEKCKN